MHTKHTVLPRRDRAALLAVVPLIAMLAGCGDLANALNLQKPGARITGVQLKDIDLTAATLLFDVELKNPYSVPLPLVNVDYGLASRETAFLSGKADLQGSVPAGGTKTVSVPAAVTYSKLLNALKGVKLGSVVPYKADLGLSVDVPAAGPLRLPLSKEGQLPVPAPPDVQVEQIQWQKLTLDSAGGTVKLRVANRNEFPVELGKFAYGLALGEVEVARSSIAKPLALAANGGAGSIEIPISFSPKSAGLAVFRMLTGSGSGYKLTGDMNVQTPFGPMRLPVEKLGKTIFK